MQSLRNFNLQSASPGSSTTTRFQFQNLYLNHQRPVLVDEVNFFRSVFGCLGFDWFDEKEIRRGGRALFKV